MGRFKEMDLTICGSISDTLRAIRKTNCFPIASAKALQDALALLRLNNIPHEYTTNPIGHLEDVKLRWVEDGERHEMNWLGVVHDYEL